MFLRATCLKQLLTNYVLMPFTKLLFSDLSIMAFTFCIIVAAFVLFLG